MSATAPDTIPLFDLVLEDEDVAAVVDALRSGWLTMGPRIEAFEEAFAAHLGVAHAIATSSCTAALHLAYLAAGIGPGDEVIVPSLTFVATANAAVYCGARPVFGLSCRFGGDSSVGKVDVDAGAAEVDHRDQRLS
jgi:dTDP-4-amino-4,6-dideoxygalactose transaminase